MTRIIAALFALATSTIAANAAEPGALPDHRPAHGTNHIATAWLADATQRYQHYVLGSDYEAASLAVRLADGRVLKLALPNDSVFEDRSPRLADLDGDGRDEIIVVRSYLARGAALAVVTVRNDKLEIMAETPPTGRPNTWLNPAGIADFDGDGRLDVAYVQMPHVLGLLRVWTLRAGKLVELAQLPDTSNHRAGSPNLGLAAVADFNGDGAADLAIPTRDRRAIRIISVKGGIRELSRHPLPIAADADFKLVRNGTRWDLQVGSHAGKPVVITLP